MSRMERLSPRQDTLRSTSLSYLSVCLHVLPVDWVKRRSTILLFVPQRRRSVSSFSFRRTVRDSDFPRRYQFLAGAARCRTNGDTDLRRGGEGGRSTGNPPTRRKKFVSLEWWNRGARLGLDHLPNFSLEPRSIISRGLRRLVRRMIAVIIHEPIHPECRDREFQSLRQRLRWYRRRCAAIPVTLIIEIATGDPLRSAATSVRPPEPRLAVSLCHVRPLPRPVLSLLRRCSFRLRSVGVIGLVPVR